MIQFNTTIPETKLEDVVQFQSPRQTGSSRSSGNSQAASGLIRAYSHRPLFAGEWNDNITEAVLLYDTLCDMCNVDEEEKLKCVPVMLKDSALNYYNANLKKCTSYSECIEKLRAWYTSDEQRNRLLNERQNMRLSTHMRLHPEKSHVEVFRDISSKLSSIQRQLHPYYHLDRFLRDELIRSADNSQIALTLKERIPKSANEANQRIAALLSSEAGSAGRYSETYGPDGHDIVNFGYDRRFGGSARKTLKTPTSHYRRRNTRKVKGCWVCGKSHFSRDHHESREIRSALDRHRRQGRVYISIDDVERMCNEEYEMEDDTNPVGDCSDDTSNPSSSEDMVNYGLSEVNSEIEQKFSDKSFLHGFQLHYSREMEHMIHELNKPEDFKPSFQGVMCDTGANRSSIMSLKQYQAYCREHLRPAALQSPGIDTSSTKKMHGFAGSTSTIGHADIAIPIEGLKIVPTIRFHIVDHDCPTILCLRDMKRLGIEISIQNNCLVLGNLKHALVQENDLLWLKWRPYEQVLYTEEELRKLHK